MKIKLEGEPRDVVILLHEGGVRYKSYEVVASDDLAHIFLFNCAVLYRLLEIYRRYKTGVVIAYEEGDE